MPDPKPAAAEEETADGEANDASVDPFDFEALKKGSDVEGLLTLAKAYRAGTAPGGRDLKRCLETYRAAAELGSADAEFAVALFCMTGGVVTQDFKEGTTRLRSAAEKGSVPAKVYLGNLYELGIHYKADREKADVWYRNAARGARVDAEPDTEEYTQALAELGCVRHVLALTEQGSVDDSEKERLLQRARAHGYALRLKDDAPADRPTFLNALEGAESTTKPSANTTQEASKPDDPERKPETKPHKPSSDRNAKHALGAFGYALLFAMAGLGAAYAATLGARELVSHGKLLPGLGTRSDLVFPIVFAVIGVLPTSLVYKLGAVVKGLVMGAAFAGVGWIAWGTGQATLHSYRPVQAFAFGVAGFLAGLLVLGLLGGAKPPRPPTRRYLSD